MPGGLIGRKWGAGERLRNIVFHLPLRDTPERLEELGTDFEKELKKPVLNL